MSLLFPDTTRITTWNPGIEGGIPSRTVIYATANAATYGNGVTDATAYLQGLFDACPSGQVVYLPAGRYKISSRLVVTKSIVIRGAGPNSVTQIDQDNPSYITSQMPYFIRPEYGPATPGGRYRYIGQTTEITAISGNTITVRDGLHLDYPLSRT